MFPYLDLNGFRRRTTMPIGDVDYTEENSPGYITARIALRTSWMNSRFRKRYGNTLPFGVETPELQAAGVLPPKVTLSGQPVLGCVDLQVVILSGTTFKYSTDGALSWSGALTIAPTFAIAGTGLTLNFPTGVYASDQSYLAATPVPETVLGWLVIFVTYDVYRKRGVNPQDPQIELLVEEMKTALADIKESADGENGLFDLPVNEDTDTAISTGGPQGYSETSPYVWQDREFRQGHLEDSNRNGSDT